LRRAIVNRKHRTVPRKSLTGETISLLIVSNLKEGCV